MKKLLAIYFLLATTITINAQKTFTSKKEALEFLKETFEANFVKTAVVGKEDGKKFNDYNWYYDYKLTDEYLIINRKSNDQPFDIENDPSTQMKFKYINFVNTAKRSNNFKNTPSLVFFSKGFSSKSFGNRNIGIQDKKTYRIDGIDMPQYFVNIPFINAYDDEVPKSVNNAIEAITKENENVATENKRINAETKKLESENAINKQKLLFKEKYSVLPNYKVYTEDGLQKILPYYLESNRQFKDKPTLIMNWSYKWCPPCIRIIDEILKADLAKKYNVILVNRNDETEISFSDIRVLLANKSPGYTTDATVLFDRNDEFAPMDGNSVPLFLWLDKNLKIVDVHWGYDITTKLIGETLLEVEQNTKN
jgi:thiol-disulfide isomerase/thioredoxin